MANSNNSSSGVLIIDGGSYLSARKKVCSRQSNGGDPNGFDIDMVRFVAEIEALVGVSFFTRYFYTSVDSPEFIKYLESPKPYGPQIRVEKFSIKWQGGLTAVGSYSKIAVEKGVDVALAVKIISCAFGINSEQKADFICVVSGDGDLYPALEAADSLSTLRNRLFVLGEKASLSSSLYRFVCTDRNRNGVFLEDILLRCMVSGASLVSSFSLLAPNPTVVSSPIRGDFAVADVSF